MKKIFFTTLVFSSILASCGQRRTPNYGDYENKIVLGAFTDMTSSSTLNESLLKDLPRYVDLSSDMSSVKNQSDRNMCTIFSTMGIIEGALKKDLALDVNLSEEYLNYSAKMIGNYQKIEGSIISENIKGMELGGLLLEDDWSYQPSWFNKDLPCAKYKDSKKLAPRICFTHNKPNSKALERVIDSKNIKFQHFAKNTNNLIKFLANNKRPVTMSLNVNFKAWPTSGITDFNEKFREECLKMPSKCAGHSVVVTGYDMNKRVFMFKNSWGSKWGKNGYGTIPFDAVDRYVSEGFFYAKVIGKVKIPKSSNSKPQLSKFDISTSVKGDQSLNVNINGEVEGISGKMLHVSTYIVKKPKVQSYEYPNDLNTEQIRLSDAEEIATVGDKYISAKSYNIPYEENYISLASINDSKLFFPSSTLSIQTLENLKNADHYDFFLRTTIYVHSDYDSFVILKRQFTPIFLK